MTLELGVKKNILTEEPEEDGWYGPFHDPDFVLKVLAKLRRQQKYRGQPTLLTGIGDNKLWLQVPATVVEQAIRRSPSQKYRNCKVSTKWWLSVSKFSVSVWPMEHRDASLNSENNWGEEE